MSTQPAPPFAAEHYVPILKGKGGEFDALRTLPAAVSAALTPLIEVPPLPWDFELEAPSRTWDQHVTVTIDGLLRSTGALARIFIDMPSLDAGVTLADGRHPLTAILEALRAAGIVALPVTGLARPADYDAAAAAAHRLDGHGVVLRIADEDFASPTFAADLTALQSSLGVNAADVDFVIDLGSLNGSSARVLTVTAAADIAAVPTITAWRTFSVVFSAFPPDLSAVSTTRTGRLPRNDAAAWRALTSAGLPRTPTYGDYGPENPQYPSLDPRLPTSVASVRYTSDRHWLVVRGQLIRRPRGIGYDQFRDLSARVMAEPEYRGAGFSPGDQYIDQCAAGGVGTGNLQTWRYVAFSHHLVHVTDAIATSAGP